MSDSKPTLDLEDRYGRKRSSLRYLLYLIFLALLGWLYWSGSYHSNPVVVPNLISFKAIDEKQMGINFEITRRDPNQAITCRLTAIDIDKYIVGEVEYRVAPGDKHMTISTTIPTRSKSVSASVVSCVPTT